jgi:cytochrome c-type biogenesis protein CcmE
LEPQTRSQRKTERARSSRRLPYYIGGAIVVAVVGWLLYSNILNATAPYLTVTELLVEGPSDRLVRVTGVVVGQTIVWDAEELKLRFDIADEDGASISVEYSGVRPDLLEDGTQAVVEGSLRDATTFDASAILLKCPSKYEVE